MTIGTKVRQLRMTRRLTQQELAERAGVSQAIISKRETEARDNVTSDVLKALAQVLGCTTDYLVGMHEDKDSEQLTTATAKLVRRNGRGRCALPAPRRGQGVFCMTRTLTWGERRSCILRSVYLSGILPHCSGSPWNTADTSPPPGYRETCLRCFFSHDKGGIAMAEKRGITRRGAPQKCDARRRRRRTWSRRPRPRRRGDFSPVAHGGVRAARRAERAERRDRAGLCGVRPREPETATARVARLPAVTDNHDAVRKHGQNGMELLMVPYDDTPGQARTTAPEPCPRCGVIDRPPSCLAPVRMAAKPCAHTAGGFCAGCHCWRPSERWCIG